jgi:hypothetical protein
MMRKVPIKMDFLRAIEYELNLEELRKARKAINGTFSPPPPPPRAHTRMMNGSWRPDPTSIHGDQHTPLAGSTPAFLMHSAPAPPREPPAEPPR